MGLGLLCPGQGAQNPGMLSALLPHPAARAVLDEAATVLGRDLVAAVGGPPEALFANTFAQPLLCAAQMAAWAALRPDLPAPLAFAGYSVGELAAYGCAGSLGLPQLLRLARARAVAMDAACPQPNGLIAVRGLSRDTLQPLCDRHGVAIAIVNDFDRLIVGGLAAPLAALAAEVEAMGAGITRLSVGIASHTPLMTPARSPFAAALTASGMTAPAVPVLAGIDGTPVLDAGRARDTLLAQLDHPVLWQRCLEALPEMGCTVLLELGPCNGLARMAADRLPDIAVRSIADFRSLGAALRWVESRL